VLEALWLRTGSAVHRTLSEFWTRIFAISFGMGVVSGIVMSFQFGTNWSVWSDTTGFVLGPLIQYEVVTAFFLEMVAIGLLMAAVGSGGLYLRLRGRLFQARGFMRLVSLCLPIGFVAILCGWFTTEIGRQPWTVYGLLRTEDSVTPALTGEAALTSLVVYVVAYSAIFTAGTSYLFRLLRIGPRPALADTTADARHEAHPPKRPLSKPAEAIEPGE